MLKKILIMGLPGSGKTTLAKNIMERLASEKIPAQWHNADSVRMMFEDWDFSPEGRERQAGRMGDFADRNKKDGIVAICDFICPTIATRELFGPADLIIWMDTITKGRYEDTNKMFEPPAEYDLRIRSFAPQQQEKVETQVIDAESGEILEETELSAADAYQLGREACLAGKPRRVPKEIAEASEAFEDAWLSGWNEADAEKAAAKKK